MKENEKNNEKITVNYSENGKSIEQVLSEIFKDLYKRKIIEENFNLNS